MRNLKSKLGPQTALMPEVTKVHDHSDMKNLVKGDLMQLTHQGPQPTTSEQKELLKKADAAAAKQKAAAAREAEWKGFEDKAALYRTAA